MKLSPQLLPCFVGPSDTGYKSPFITIVEAHHVGDIAQFKRPVDVELLDHGWSAYPCPNIPPPPEIRVFLAGPTKDEGWLS